MSRIGNQPIALPKDVTITIEGPNVTIKGPKGQLSQEFNRDMLIESDDQNIVVKRPSDARGHRALHGVTRSLIANMVEGVSSGFSKTLEFVGVGYRAQQSGKGLTLSLMLSHPVDIQPPDGIMLEVEGNNIVKVSGIDKQAVGQIAAEIRSKRPPNSYTGNGIRYQGQQIRIKPGKSARAAEA